MTDSITTSLVPKPSLRRQGLNINKKYKMLTSALWQNELYTISQSQIWYFDVKLLLFLEDFLLTDAILCKYSQIFLNILFFTKIIIFWKKKNF
jgi:hypothetical protein